MNEEFLGQRNDEEVVLVFRRHPIVMARGFLLFILLSAIGFLPYIIVPSNQQLLFVAAGGVLIGIIILFFYWINWYFSVFILTNQRIRQNTQRGLFHKSVVDIENDKIMSAFINIKGFGASLLGYGTIIIHTQVGDMRMKKIASAEAVYDKIQEIIAKVENEKE